VKDGLVTFSAPANGASASLTTSPAAISNGRASVTASANGVNGPYSVTVTATGANTLNFVLENLKTRIFVPFLKK
jgi:hypothetical protein